MENCGVFCGSGRKKQDELLPHAEHGGSKVQQGIAVGNCAKTGYPELRSLIFQLAFVTLLVLPCPRLPKKDDLEVCTNYISCGSVYREIWI